MELIRNYNPIWTMQHLENIRNSINSFGYFTQQWIEECEERIRRGEAVIRCSNDVECYEIHENGQYIGDITATPDGEECREIDLLIFEGFRHSRNGKRALEMFINENIRRYGLSAIVRDVNPDKDRIKRILLELRFFQLSDNDFELPKSE